MKKKKEDRTQAWHLDKTSINPFIHNFYATGRRFEALAKIMEFGRAVSIFLLVVHVYVYCYPSITAWHLNLEVIDRILINFNNTTGIFNCILWSKLSAVLLLAVSCLGTHGVKGEKITWPKIYAALVAGCALFFLTGGFLNCHCHTWQIPHSIFLLLRQAISPC